MKYEVRFWHGILEETELKHEQVILGKTLIKLIDSKKVNVMIQHRGHMQMSICWLDKGNFRQR